MQDKIKILVVQIGKIGDMILTTPLLNELKRMNPESELHVLAGSKNFIIAEKLSSVDHTYKYSKEILKTPKLILQLRKKHFDLWIDTKDEYSSTSKLLKNLCRPLKSIGYNVKEKVFDIDLSDYENGKHKVDINLTPIKYLSGLKNPDRIYPRIEIPGSDSDNVLKRTENISGEKILLNVSAGISTRDLETDKWIELANGIKPEYNVILTGQEKDYENIKTVIKAIERSNKYFVETNTIFELAELIRNCRMIVTPDTSAVHLASCFNIPIVCFYHNVEWVRIKFAPLSDKQRIVVSKDENSFKSITAAELIKAVNELLT